MRATSGDHSHRWSSKKKRYQPKCCGAPPAKACSTVESWFTAPAMASSGSYWSTCAGHSQLIHMQIKRSASEPFACSDSMSEPTSSPNEPTTSPVATTTPPPQPTDVERDPEPRRSRVTAVAAWVGIVAGVVFIVAVVFFSGFILGAHSGRPPRQSPRRRGPRPSDHPPRRPAAVPDGSDGPAWEFERRQVTILDRADPASSRRSLRRRRERRALQLPPAPEPLTDFNASTRGLFDWSWRSCRTESTAECAVCTRFPRFAYETAHSAW